MYFQIHGPDFGTPYAEVVLTMDELVRAGKLRYVGACNLRGWAMQKYVEVAKQLGCNPWVTLQVCYVTLKNGITCSWTIDFH